MPTVSVGGRLNKTAYPSQPLFLQGKGINTPPVSKRTTRRIANALRSTTADHIDMRLRAPESLVSASPTGYYVRDTLFPLWESQELLANLAGHVLNNRHLSTPPLSGTSKTTSSTSYHLPHHEKVRGREASKVPQVSVPASLVWAGGKEPTQTPAPLCRRGSHARFHRGWRATPTELWRAKVTVCA
jgi:hypothetical protein